MTKPLIGQATPSRHVHGIPFLSLLAAGVALLLPASLFANSSKSGDQAQEYIQVRKIALKDPKVQAAFDRANEKLNERIIEIDPSLKPYVEKHATAPKTEETPKTAPAAPKHEGTSRKNVSHPPAATTHVVTKGETLSTIAEHYKVSVASLKAANNIVDERKLRVGQKLVIPSPKSGASSGSAQPHKEKEQGFWDKVKNSF